MIVHAFSFLSNYLVLNQIDSSFIGKCASHLHKFHQLTPRPGALPLDSTGGVATATALAILCLAQ